MIEGEQNLGKDSIDLPTVGEIEAQGIYSLLTDKGTNVIARRPNGKPIYAIAGGCTNDAYCERASLTLRETIDFEEDSEERCDLKITPKKQEIYKAMLRDGSAKIDPRTGHAKVAGWLNNLLAPIG